MYLQHKEGGWLETAKRPAEHYDIQKMANDNSFDRIVILREMKYHFWSNVASRLYVLS